MGRNKRKPKISIILTDYQWGIVNVALHTLRNVREKVEGAVYFTEPELAIVTKQIRAQRKQKTIAMRSEIA